MRKYVNVLTALFFGSILMVWTGCEEELETSEREEFIVGIAQDWTVGDGSYVVIEEQDVTHLLTGFELAIDEDLNYTSNSDQLSLEEFPWPIAGSFTLNEELTELTRDDGLLITLVLDEEDGSLQFNFEADDNTTGRTVGIRGGWKCKLRRRR